MNKKNSRIGEIRTMNCGEEAEIVEYKNNSNIIVRFVKSGELVKCQYNQFRIGNVKSHFTPTVHGVGIVGLETTTKREKHIGSYAVWYGMLQRCYSEKCQQKYPTYKNCTVCDEWLYYPNFKEWYEDNYYEIEGQKMCLDKDILVRGIRFTVQIIVCLCHNI